MLLLTRFQLLHRVKIHTYRHEARRKVLLFQVEDDTMDIRDHIEIPLNRALVPVVHREGVTLCSSPLWGGYDLRSRSDDSRCSAP